MAAKSVDGAFVRRWLLLVVEVSLDKPLQDDQWDKGRCSTAVNVEPKAYFHDRVFTALHENRWHRAAAPEDQPSADLTGLEVVEVEVVRFRQEPKRTNGLLIVHAKLPESDRGLLSALEKSARLEQEESDARPIRDWYEGMLRRCGTTSAGMRATTLTFVTPRKVSLPDPPWGSALKDWTPQNKWLWFLASATSDERYPPSPDELKKLVAKRIVFSETWCCLVLRDGTAFLGCKADRGSTVHARFYPEAESRVRSIYLDAILLGMIQRISISEIADKLAELEDPISDPEALRTVEENLRRFRNVFWWRQVTRHSFGNDLLTAYQDQHQLGVLVEQTVDELAEYSRQAERLAAEKTNALAEKTNALLALLTILGAPFGLAFGVLQVLQDKAILPVALGFGLAALVAAILSWLGYPLLRPLPDLVEPLLGGKVCSTIGVAWRARSGVVAGMGGGLLMAAPLVVYDWAKASHSALELPMAVTGWLFGLNYYHQTGYHWWPIVIGALFLLAYWTVQGLAFARLASWIYRVLFLRGTLVLGGIWAFVSFMFFWYMLLPIARDGAPLRLTAHGPHVFVAPNWVWILGFILLGCVTSLSFVRTPQ